MAFVHRKSCEGVKSELDLFGVPPTQTSTEDAQWVEHQPMASLESGGPIEFLLPGWVDTCLDIASSYLHVQAKGSKFNGTPLDPDNAVAPVNNWLHSLFSQLDVYLNGTLVTPSRNTYPYRAYIETLLSYGNEAKETQLRSQLRYKDTAGRMDAVDIVDEDVMNRGLVSRRAHVTQSRFVDMMGRLHVDLFLQDRYMLNGVDVKIRLVRSKYTFALMAGGGNLDYKVHIVNATMFARKATLNPTVQMAHIRHWTRARPCTRCVPSTAKYIHFRQGLCRTRTKTCFSVPYRNVWYYAASTTTRTTVRTRRTRFTPSTTTSTSSPFTWMVDRYPPNLSSRISTRIDPNPNPNPYLNLFTSTGKVSQDEGNGLTRDDFRDGYTFFGFDLTPCDGSCFHLVQKGNLRIEMHFDAALQQTINVVVYAEFESVLEIDKSRNIINDF